MYSTESIKYQTAGFTQSPAAIIDLPTRKRRRRSRKSSRADVVDTLLLIDATMEVVDQVADTVTSTTMMRNTTTRGAEAEREALMAETDMMDEMMVMIIARMMEEATFR